MSEIEEDLNKLERDVRQFKIEFEQYFGGGRMRPPADVEWRVELILKRYAERTAELSYGERFRYNGLAQTYAKYREMFRKRFKQREEGYVPRHFGAAARNVAASRTQHAPPFSVTCSDPDRETGEVERLFEAFVKAKQKAGENVEQLSLNSFQDFLREKTQELRKQEGCREVEYVVAVEEGQVRLKARVKS